MYYSRITLVGCTYIYFPYELLVRVGNKKTSYYFSGECSFSTDNCNTWLFTVLWHLFLIPGIYLTPPPSAYTHTPRDQYLFSGSVDHSIKMWNIERLEVVASMPAHDNPVCTLTINGNRLYSGSLKSIKVKNYIDMSPSESDLCTIGWLEHICVAVENSIRLYTGKFLRLFI